MKLSSRLLPAEFLYQISGYLPLQDCYNCLYVSRLWYRAFQRVIYRTINIYSDTQFKKFLSSLCLSKSLHNDIQHNETIDFLEDLDDPYYIKNIEINQKQLMLLNDLCPQLEIFEFDKSQWKHLEINTQMKLWKHMKQFAPIHHSTFLDFPFMSVFGSSLTYLNIDYCYSSQTEEAMTSFLYQIPTLEHLTVDIFFKGHQNTRRMLNISKLLQHIHIALPNLHTLELVRSNPSRHEPPAAVYESNILSNFVNKSTLRSLTLEGHVDSIKWFEFIQDNYPYLEDLKINQLATSRFGTKWMWQQSLVNLIRNLSQMKTLTIGGRNAPQLLSKNLARELKSPRCTIQNLYIDFKTYQAIESCQFLMIIAEFGLKQLRFLRLRVWQQTPEWTGVTHNLFECRQLVSLELSLSKGLMDQYPFTPFLIDNFLENMPQLQELSLVGAEIQVLCSDVAQLDTLRTFSLSSLVLIQSRVQHHKTVFSYLSLCCPKLKQLSFRRCEVTKPKHQTPHVPACISHYCNLDMPHTQLDKIGLSSFLIYNGAVETIEYIGIKMVFVDSREFSLASTSGHSLKEKVDEESKRIAWCRISGFGQSFVYPQYSVVEEEDRICELNSLHDLYTDATEIMPGNYVPSMGIITVRCKSVSDVYLDNVRVSRNSFIKV
ncbi:hypothetical protein BY458DRAFT_520357 [Sporodiniella umbellata]|nr:hypothetical protein BY458DRAFT_520357 [Sporodiniella umbellata]